MTHPRLDAVLLFPPAPHVLTGNLLLLERALLGSTLLALVLFVLGHVLLPRWPSVRLALALIGLSSASACSILALHLGHWTMWRSTAMLVLVSVFLLCL